MQKSRVFRLISASLLASASALSISGEARAQVKRPMPDDNGVDVISGAVIIPSGHLTIGQPDQGGLEFYRIWQGGGWYHNLNGAVTQNGDQFTISVEASVETFTLTGGVYNSDDGKGSTLTKSVNGTWTYTLADGTVITFENPGTLGGIQGGIKGLLRSITGPNGLVTILTNKYQSFCEFLGPNCDTPPEYVARLQSVTTNTGYHLKFEYAQNFTTSTVKPLGMEENWLRMVKVTGINGAIDYCDPNANSCTSLTQSWPFATIAKNAGSPGDWTDVWADALANTTTGTVTNSALASIQSPADPSTDFSITYTSGKVSQFTRGGGTWNYSYADVGAQRTTTVTQPLGGSKIYVSDTSLRKLISSTDELSRTTSYQYDSFVRPTRVTQPEGNYAEVTYDARGNVTQRRSVAKTGSGLADIVSSAGFDASCSNTKTCNQPNSTTDARGNVTDYTYDATHGGVLTVTQPAPAVGAVRPQIRYTYATRQAYYKNSGGSIVASGLPIYLPTAVSACQTLASCAGGGDEVKATADYGPQVTGTANNLLPVSTSKGSGNGGLTATITRAWDMFGNLTSMDGPLSGTADTWGFRYDADRRLTMRVSPDPDGAGILKFRAERLTYNADSNVTKVEAGTTTTLTGAFTPVASGERAELAYDALGRKSKQSLMSSTSTTHDVTQYSYDPKGRLPARRRG